MCDLQEVDTARGVLRKELAAVRKQAKKDGEVAKRKVAELVVEKRELQVSFCSPCGAYVTSTTCHS